MLKLLFLLCILFAHSVYGQFQIGGTVGFTGYVGDLNSTAFKRIKPALGAIGIYEVTDRLNLRAGLMIGKMEGGDRWSGTSFLKQNRNLSFTSELTEMSIVAEYTLFPINKSKWSPYVFAGISLFHFDPYVIDSGGKRSLRTLNTEGQSFPEYPDRKPYSLTQFTKPFGFGAKYVVNDFTLVSFEVGWRRTGTDYLDDVSTAYIDQSVLFNNIGNKAIDFSYRGDEVKGESASYPDNGYPLPGVQRGSPKYNDWYYFTGFHIFFRLNSRYGGTSIKPKRTAGCVLPPI